jgi:hypothetical protein
MRLKKVISSYENKYYALTKFYRDFLKAIKLNDNLLNDSNHTFNLRTRFGVNFNTR